MFVHVRLRIWLKIARRWVGGHLVNSGYATRQFFHLE